MSARKIAILLLGAISFVISGCETTPLAERKPEYTVWVSSLGNGQASKFQLIPFDKRISAVDLQFKEYAGYVERALTLKGYNKAMSAEEADVVIMLGYEISDGEEKASSRQIPQFGQTGSLNLGTTGTISTFGNTSYLNAQTNTMPLYGITGVSTVTDRYTTFTRRIVVSAYDSTKSQELWTTKIVSTGSSGDLRQVFPVMVGAARVFLGKATAKAEKITILEEAPEVMVIR
tara:strand:+ start:97 stop:792 length:696 start_codon:yes stop_codon:yes gene_type:complete